MSRLLRWLLGVPAPKPTTRAVEIKFGGVVQAGVIRVTAIQRGGQYTLGWKVRSDDPGTAAAIFLARFLPSDHQSSRRAM
jgi:hypothetical protein